MAQDSSADELTWDQVLSKLGTLRDEWRAVTDGLTGDEAPPTVGGDRSDDEEQWNADQIHSHVASALFRYADTLLTVVITETGTFQRSPRRLPDDTPYSRLRVIEEHGWTALTSAIRAVGVLPDPGAVIAVNDAKVTARQLIQRAGDHVQAHTEQIRALRSDRDE